MTTPMKDLMTKSALTTPLIKKQIINIIFLILLCPISVLLFYFIKKLPKTLTLPVKMPETSLNISYSRQEGTVKMKHLTYFALILNIVIFCIFISYDNLNLTKILILIQFFCLSFIHFIMTCISFKLLKRIISSPRPFFKSVCNPNSEGFCSPYPLLYYISSNADYDKERVVTLSKGMSSMPSGHAAQAVYHSCSFIANSIFLYLNVVGLSRFQRIFLIIINVFHLILTVYICMTRVFDYYHRIVDVLVGSFLGIFFGVCYFFFIQMYKRNYTIN